MLKERTFRVVLVAPRLSIGNDLRATANQTVRHTGSKRGATERVPEKQSKFQTQ